MVRNFDVHRHGFAVATDGHLLVISHVRCEDGNVALYTCKTPRKSEHMLWPSDHRAKTSTLRSLPGLVLLIGLLTSSPERLGHVPPSCWPEHPEWVLESVLGMGAFATAILGKRSASSDDVVFKVPCYSCDSPALIETQRTMLQRELRVLHDISVATAVSKHIPHALEQHDDIPCLILAEVGMSMLNYIAIYKPMIQDRSGSFCVTLEAVLTTVLTEVHKTTGYTHRDVRPQNVVMRRDADGTLIPMLIDWAPSGRDDEPYEKLHSSDFQHDAVIAHFLEQEGASTPTPLQKYELDFDLRSAIFTSTAIIYSEGGFLAPWHDAHLHYYSRVRGKMVEMRHQGKKLDVAE